eukprot:1016717-Pyramimonas_sp.AAC.1
MRLWPLQGNAMTRCPLDSRTPWSKGQAPGRTPPNGLDGAREPRRQTLQRQAFPCLVQSWQTSSKGTSEDWGLRSTL